MNRRTSFALTLVGACLLLSLVQVSVAQTSSTSGAPPVAPRVQVLGTSKGERRLSIHKSLDRGFVNSRSAEDSLIVKRMCLFCTLGDTQGVGVTIW